MDRWIAATHGAELRRVPMPVAVDLGYGAAPWTAVELLYRLRRVAPHTRVVGIEIDPARVAAAQPYAREGLAFRHGGFEVPLPPGPLPEGPLPPGPLVSSSRPGVLPSAAGGPGAASGGSSSAAGDASAAFGDGPAGTSDTSWDSPDGAGVSLIRAANVLRQYEEGEVAGAWERLRGRLAPAAPSRGTSGGLLVEGTCDEIGRRHVWVALGPEGPRTVTFATRLASLDRPSGLAERLPKVLIHRNVPGEPVHAFLRDFDRAWASAAPYAAYGARQRWITAVRALAGHWPVLDGPGRWRHGEVTVAWGALAPRGWAPPG
jgi:hypothetical protein